MAFNTIKLKKYTDIIEEIKAHETIYPGSLLYLNSDDEVALHATAGGNVSPQMFALEDELRGNGINDAYSSGDMVQVWIATRGEVVYAILADGNDVNIGDALESNGAGYLQKHTPLYASSDPGHETRSLYSNPVVGIALENVDSSADSSGVDFLSVNKRIKVRIA